MYKYKYWKKAAFRIPIRHKLQDSRLMAVSGNTIAHTLRISTFFQRADSKFMPMAMETEGNPESFLKGEFLSILLLQRARP